MKRWCQNMVRTSHWIQCFYVSVYECMNVRLCIGATHVLYRLCNFPFENRLFSPVKWKYTYRQSRCFSLLLFFFIRFVGCVWGLRWTANSMMFDVRWCGMWCVKPTTDFCWIRWWKMVEYNWLNVKRYVRAKNPVANVFIHKWQWAQCGDEKYNGICMFVVNFHFQSINKTKPLTEHAHFHWKTLFTCHRCCSVPFCSAPLWFAWVKTLSHNEHSFRWIQFLFSFVRLFWPPLFALCECFRFLGNAGARARSPIRMEWRVRVCVCVFERTSKQKTSR